MLPINNSVPIENVVVAESGDDSEDEWDYIKGDKEKHLQQDIQPLADVDHDSDLLLEKDQQHIDEHESFVTSPTPPTASLGAADFIEPSHAVAQAFAEPEEACVEVFLLYSWLLNEMGILIEFLCVFQLGEEKQNTELSEPFGLEQVEHVEHAEHIEHIEHVEHTEHIDQLIPAASENDSDLGNEHDLEDMDSQLNPGKQQWSMTLIPIQIFIECVFAYL